MVIIKHSSGPKVAREQTFLMKDLRVNRLELWAKGLDSSIPASARLENVSGDASFRRYFRFPDASVPRVFVDAPPEHEDNPSFARISAAMIEAGLNVPVVFAADFDQGFMMISDLGDEVYLDRIERCPEDVESLYQDAVRTMIRMQSLECDLPLYDEKRLLDEMSLFHEWFLARQLQMELTDNRLEFLFDAYQLLIDNALEQPVCFVHRDFHGRNLMIVSSNPPGIIDFQDAVRGPVTYDLVSLYKDCYHRFDREWVEKAVAGFHISLIENGLLRADQPVLRWFDLMGAQRHLKCAGIFSRLNLRDGKSSYLADIPLVVDYLIEVADLYEDLGEFSCWLKEDVQPRLIASEFMR